jgi:hypothetical protein
LLFLFEGRAGGGGRDLVTGHGTKGDNCDWSKKIEKDFVEKKCRQKRKMREEEVEEGL